jgi:hypothetical protein
MPPRKRYRCRYCGYDFPAALPVTHEPNGALLLNHLAAMHRGELRPYLARMAAGEDIARVAQVLSLECITGAELIAERS